MSKCTKCSGYTESYGLCPACQRDEAAAEEQRNLAFDIAEKHERDQASLQRQALVQEFTKKLLDLALEGLENKGIAAEKVNVLMRSPNFSQNEGDIWGEIEANQFLADCYYRIRLGNPPVLDGIRALPYHSQKSLAAYIRASGDSPFITELKKVHQQFQAEVKDEEARQAEAAEKAQLAWDKANKVRQEQQRVAVEASRKRAARMEYGVNLASAFYTLIHIASAALILFVLSQGEAVGLGSLPVAGFWCVAALVLAWWTKAVFSTTKEKQREGYPWFGFSWEKEWLGDERVAMLYELIITGMALFFIFKSDKFPAGTPRILALSCLGLYTYVFPIRRVVTHIIGGLLSGAVVFFVSKLGFWLLNMVYFLIWKPNP